MDTVDSVDLRAIEKLKRDMGRSLMEALEDPETLEIMLNPDGKLWREKFGQPMFCMGTVPVGVRLENGKYPTLRLFFVRFDIDIA